jgi:hypothetical protein
VWWQAQAWAGKSALLSTFVLHPPAGVRVVAFFITARGDGRGRPARAGRCDGCPGRDPGPLDHPPGWQPYALTKLAGAMAEASQHEQAETVARSITNPDEQALAEVAKALIARGEQDRRAARPQWLVPSDDGPRC